MTKLSVVLNDDEIDESKLKFSNNGKSSGQSSTDAKRQKTGGRVRLPVAQRIDLAVQRSQIAALSDDTTLESELAALYLAVSEKKLEELRKPPSGRRSDLDQRPRLTFLKIFDEGAVGRNQPVLYKLGDLREFQRSIRATNTFQAAVNAGLAAWVRVKHPFFVQKTNAGNTVILADAWDLNISIRDELFGAFFRREIALKWMSPANAALAIWKDPQAHYCFVKNGEGYWMRLEIAMKSAVERSRRSDPVFD